MSQRLRDRVHGLLEQRQRQKLFRATQAWDSSLINFASNDYLSLRSVPALKSALANSAARYGLGSGAAHLLGGHHLEHVNLENALCDWLEARRCLLFTSGYQAAFAALGALATKADFIAADRLSHACLLDAAQLSGAVVRRFKHNDVLSAADVLDTSAAAKSEVRWLVAESVYSMDGDFAPLSGLLELAAREDCAVLLDEAHAVGVVGPSGAGLAQALGLAQNPTIRLVTFGKALGSSGAALLCDQYTADAITNFGRPYIYTTAMPPALAAATTASVGLARKEHWRLDQLQENVWLFRSCCRERGLAITPTTTDSEWVSPIHIFPVAQLSDAAGGANDAEAALALSSHLKDSGFFVPAVRTPTVPAGQARLRITLNTEHKPAEIRALASALENAVASLNSCATVL